MKSKGNFSGKGLVRSFIRLISAPFSSHAHARVEVPNPTETVNRYPATFIYDHLQFFNPEFNPSVHSIDEVIPFRPMEEAISRNLYKATKEVDVNRKVSSPIRSLSQKYIYWQKLKEKSKTRDEKTCNEDLRRLQ